MDKTIASGDGLRRIAVAIRGAKLSFELDGAVVFGSMAKGKVTPDSDVDVLVVGRGLPPKRQRRSAQVIEIKRLVPMPLDVFLLTPQETDSNFANHNPLFLDIAEDGIILFDRNGKLAEMMQSMRRYVRDRGIVRMDDGWLFPVTYGSLTYLSKVSNRDFALAMLNDATRDNEIAERLMSDGFCAKSVYHFQQAAEKAVKAVLIAMGVFRKTHLIGSALREMAQGGGIDQRWQSALLQAAELSEELEPDVGLSRYPAIINDALWLPSEEYTLEDAAAASEKAGKVLETARRFIADWFAQPPPH